MKNWPKGEICWCFGLINGRLAEVYFQKGMGAKGVFAHGCIDKLKFSKEKQKVIDAEIQRHQFTYRKNKYVRVE